MVPTLETERLRLRPFREEDVEGMFEFFSDPQTQKFYGPDYTRGRVWRGVAAYMGHWQLRGFGHWAVEDKDSGRLAGYCGLWYPADWDDVELGYGLLPDYRGRGIAFEAAQRALRFGSLGLGLKRIVSYIHPLNHRSIRLAERLGAGLEGTYAMSDTPHAIYVYANKDQQGVDNGR